ncbi:unnamed protein product, partial [Sphacelaria rigidula]
RLFASNATAPSAPYFCVTGAQAATGSKDLGCYADSQSARRFELGVTGSPENDQQVTQTPRFCFDFCNTKGTYQYFGLQYGSECWCGVSGADYAGLGSLPQSSCTKPCTGSPEEDCGGSNALQVRTATRRT